MIEDIFSLWPALKTERLARSEEKLIVRANDQFIQTLRKPSGTRFEQVNRDVRLADWIQRLAA